MNIVAALLFAGICGLLIGLGLADLLRGRSD